MIQLLDKHIFIDDAYTLIGQALLYTLKVMLFTHLDVIDHLRYCTTLNSIVLVEGEMIDGAQIACRKS